MKLKKISIKNHPVLGNLDVNFIDRDGKILNTVVIAGVNGSGKTNLLEAISKEFLYNVSTYKSQTIYEELNDFKYKELKKYEISEILEQLRYFNKGERKNYEILEKIKKVNFFPKFIYIPTEINFGQLKTESNSLSLNYNFFNKVDQKTIENIPSYIATRINYIANVEENLTMKQVRQKVSNEINSIFEILELDVKLIGLTKDERSLPLFSNSRGEEFDINGLSSGEKQLFLRALTLKLLKAENSIVLIDEPEISLHPKWQQRILKVYESIGENNQIIVATHSPHILGSTNSKNIKLLTRDKDGIKVIDGSDLNEVYGKPVQRVLKDIMELNSLRTPEIEKEIIELRELVDNNEFDTEKFQKKYKKLVKILGSIDEDLMLIKLDVARRWKKPTFSEKMKKKSKEKELVEC